MCSLPLLQSCPLLPSHPLSASASPQISLLYPEFSYLLVYICLPRISSRTKQKTKSNNKQKATRQATLTRLTLGMLRHSGRCSSILTDATADDFNSCFIRICFQDSFKESCRPQMPSIHPALQTDPVRTSLGP